MVRVKYIFEIVMQDIISGRGTKSHPKRITLEKKKSYRLNNV